jgi:hypothetical protein
MEAFCGQMMSNHRKKVFFVLFLREDLPAKTTPAEQPTKCMWASYQIFVDIPPILVPLIG